MAKSLDAGPTFWHGPSTMRQVTGTGAHTRCATTARPTSALAFALAFAAALAAPLDRALAAPALLLEAGELRIDAGPSDFAYMDHGRLNDGRGLRLLKPGEGDVALSVGLGGAYGVVEDFEVGGMILPLMIAPDADLGGMEVYGRFSLVRGDLNVAAQITLQLPTDADFAMGLGAPMELRLSPSLRLQTGAELEIVFDPAIISLDIPAALNFDVTPGFFMGPRSGLYFDDFSELTINLGAQVGGDVGRGLTLTGSFNWPRFVDTRGTDALNVDWFEVILGLTYRIRT